jgi:hypothetical protein
MKTIASKATIAALLAAAALAPSALQAAAVIYEPFAFPDGDTTLTGNPGGTGLSGNWNASTLYTKDTGLTYGDLATVGDSSKVTSGWAKAEIGVTSSTAYSNLLADGGEMWFSMIMQVGATGNRSYFALTTRGLGGSNGDLNGDGTSPVEESVGIGFGLASNNTFYANVWDDAENGNWGGNNLTTAPDGNITTTTGTATIATHFLVGHIQWGATSADSDTITLYLPGTNLTLGDAVSSSSGIIANQSGLDTLGFQNLTNFNVYDEIRVGATIADVVVVIPEPRAALLGGLGFLLLLRRRR